MFNLVNIFIKTISGKGQFLHMNNLNLYFRFICFNPCSKTFNWAENIFSMSHLLKQSPKCTSNTAWTTTVTIFRDLTFRFQIADMMTKKTNNESKHITVKGTIFLVCNCHRIMSNGHIAPVVENNLVSLFDSSFLLCIIIYSSWGASVTYPEQFISSLKSFFVLLLKVFILNIVFCMSLALPNIFFSLYLQYISKRNSLLYPQIISNFSTSFKILFWKLRNKKFYGIMLFIII